MEEQNQFPEPNRHILVLLTSSPFDIQGHILATSGDLLRLISAHFGSAFPSSPYCPTTFFYFGAKFRKKGQK
jgi:hypothetical protein